MKVMCIKEVNNICPYTNRAPIVNVGETYTVVDTEKDAEEEMCYELAEDMNYLYACYLFAPLSNIDEKEMERSFIEVEQLNKYLS